MKFQTISSAALVVASALAHPLTKKQTTNIDTTVLQFALTLEHLENEFYHGALNKFTAQDFVNAGYPAPYYTNLEYISFDEQNHVQLLTTAVAAAGAAPVAPCTYDFPYTDVKSFITLSSVLEGVGVSAYLAGAGLITDKDYLTVAASILVTEALHTSYQRAALGEVPMANPYGTPLSPSPVYTLAAAFIKACPSTNMDLGFTVFPKLRYDAGVPVTGGASILLVSASALPADSYVTFIAGLSVVSVKGAITGAGVQVTVPMVAEGQTYVVITNKDVEGTLMDSAILFGPVIIEVTPAAPVIDDAIMKE